MTKYEKKTLRADLEKVLAQTGDEPGAAIPILQAIQDKYGYLPKYAMQIVTEQTGIPSSQLYGIATFFAQFKLNPMGRYMIKICQGTACHVSGADMLLDTVASELHIKQGETTPDGLFTLEPVACLGCCSLAPVMSINGDIYGKLTSTKVKKILKQYRQNGSQ